MRFSPRPPPCCPSSLGIKLGSLCSQGKHFYPVTHLYNPASTFLPNQSSKNLSSDYSGRQALCLRCEQGLRLVLLYTGTNTASGPHKVTNAESSSPPSSMTVGPSGCSLVLTDTVLAAGKSEIKEPALHCLGKVCCSQIFTFSTISSCSRKEWGRR